MIKSSPESSSMFSLITEPYRTDYNFSKVILETDLKSISSILILNKTHHRLMGSNHVHQSFALQKIVDTTELTAQQVENSLPLMG